MKPHCVSFSSSSHTAVVSFPGISGDCFVVCIIYLILGGFSVANLVVKHFVNLHSTWKLIHQSSACAATCRLPWTRYIPMQRLRHNCLNRSKRHQVARRAVAMKNGAQRVHAGLLTSFVTNATSLTVTMTSKKCTGAP